MKRERLRKTGDKFLDHQVALGERCHRLLQAETSPAAKRAHRRLIADAIAGNVAAADLFISLVEDNLSTLQAKLGAALARYDFVKHFPAVNDGLYYRLEEYDPRKQTYRESRRAYGTADEARAAATAPGRYRVSSVSLDGTLTEGAPFDVARPAPVPNVI